MTTTRLIVNADDLGLSTGVNEGIQRAYRHGIVTSASLMVRRPAAGHGAVTARREPGLSVGLHFDPGEWVCENGEWTLVGATSPPDDAVAVEAELEAQLSLFETLMGRKPSHLDSHQHVHRSEPAHSILCRAAERLDIPLRHYSPLVRHCGSFYGQARDGRVTDRSIGVPALLRILGSLEPGVTELGCHPGVDAATPSAYGRPRMTELATLCDATVVRYTAIHGIELISFDQLKSGMVTA